VATYYWVGGAGTWDSTSTTNWAASSGGAGGAGYPTILDDVVFDTSSGTGSVGLNNGYSFCRDFTVTASQALTFSGTLAGAAGNISLPAGGSTTFTGSAFTCIANSAKTITTNGKTIAQLIFNGINGSWTLQDALTSSGSVTVTAGTFNTNNQTVSVGTFFSSNTNTRAINLGSSSFTVTQISAQSWQLLPTTGLTFNAGTSSIFIPGNASSAPTFSGGSLTYNNVTFNNNNASSRPINITGNNTFNNLTFNSPSSTGIARFNIGGNQTVTGTLTTSGTTNRRRVVLQSDVIGTQRTFNLAAASCLGVDFRDIAITGAVGTLTGTSFGNCGNNTGITFDAAKTVYWNLAGTANWSAPGWATSSGGTPDNANFPLAQDICVFDNAGTFSIVQIEWPWHIGSIDGSTRTSAGTLTVASTTIPFVYGDVVFGTGMVVSGAVGFSFSKQGIQTLNTNGVNMDAPITVDSATGTLRFLSNVTHTANLSNTLTSGTLDLNNFIFSTNGSFILTGTLTRSIAFGTGSFTLSSIITGTIVWDGTDLTNFTLTGTPTVNVTGAMSFGTRNFISGATAGSEANAVDVNVSAGSGTVSQLLQGSAFKSINLTGFSGTLNNNPRTVYGNLIISTGVTLAAGGSATTFAGTSTTNDLTSNGKTLDFPIVIGGTGNTLRLLDAFTQGTSRAFTINSGTTFNANSFSASVGALTITTTASNPNIINLASNTLTAATVTHTAGSLIMSASLRVNVTGLYTHTAGTLDLGNQSVSFGSFTSSNSNVRTINLGSGTLTITSGGIVWQTTTISNLTFNAGTSTISCTNAATKQISSGSLTFYNINQGGLGALTVPAATFNSISNSVQPTTILFNSNTTATVANLNLNGTAGNLVTLSFGGATSSYTIEYTGSTVNTMNYVSVSYFTGARAGIFFATNSTNGGNNTNITFAAADTTPRYWVLGTGTWTNTSTANWATSSGGGGGASAPTIETNVIFDASSNVGTGAFTVTLSGTGTSAIVCNDLTISGLDGTLTWAGSGDLNVYGSLSYPAASFNRTHSGVITFRSTTTGKTITSNGQQLAGASVIFNGVGGGWTLADALNLSVAFSLSVSAGSFNTNGFSVNALQLLSTSSTVRSIILGASTVTLSSNINFTNTANLTFNAGTSTFVLSDSNISTSGATVFYNANWVSTTNTNVNISGPITFNNVQLTATASSNAKPFQFSDNVTINGTLSILSTTPTSRVLLFSNTFGTQRTLTVNSFTAPSDVDFRDIVIAGTAAPVSGTRLGNAGGNSGITFDAPKTVYFNLVSGSVWFQTAWATTPSGTPDINNFPLAQDTAAFTDVGAISSMAIGPTNYSYPTIDSSARTLALTIAQSASLNFYGGWINGTGITLTGNFERTFRGRGSYNIASNGVTFSGAVTIDCISGTYTLTSAFLLTSGTLTITSGNFNSGNQTINLSSFASSSSTTRSITFGTSTINISSSGSTPFNLGTTTGLTFSGASSTINFTHNSGNTVTFAGGGLTYGTFDIGGTTGSGTYQISGTGTTFNNITKTKPVAFSIQIPSSTTINFANFNVSGTAGNLVTLGGAGSGTTGVFNYTGTGVVSVDYVSAGTNNQFRPLPNTSGTTPYVWYLGANSTNTATTSPTPITLGAAFIAGTRRAYILTNTVASLSWTVPTDWDNGNNNFYLIGAGGTGATSVASGNNRAAGGSGGGGGYTGLTNLSLTPSSVLPFRVGSDGGGNGQKGFDTYINAQYLAGGGQGGTAATTPTSAGGAGGIGATYNGGAGAAGTFGTTASQGYGAGGAGGAGGPNGVGGAGGLGFASTTTANIAGGGGGGNGGGSAGGNASSATGGTGGNNFSGIGGGASNTSGTFGGGGGGGVGGTNGGIGGSGIDILNTIGGAGGKSGSSGNVSTANTGLYGGGGTGAGVSTAGAVATPGTGSQGVIFIVYTPLSGLFASITESLTSNNTQSAVATFNSSRVEPTTLNHTQSAVAAFNSSRTEPTTLDNTQSALAILAANISEPLSMADTATVLKTLFGTITEPVTMADIADGIKVFPVSITENLSPASIESALSEFFRSVSENTTLAETETTQANFNSAQVEPFTVNDVVISQVNFAASITENSTEADIVNAVRQIFRSIVENSGVANTQAAQVNFNASRTENFDPASNQSVQANFNSQITENLVVLDTPIGRGWFRVVDSQTVTWTAINNGQSVTWQNVGNDQNPNWVVVNNSQE
jgi:hypothetical protein